MADEAEVPTDDDMPAFAAPPEVKRRGRPPGQRGKPEAPVSRSHILRSAMGREDAPRAEAPRRQRLIRGGVTPDKYYIDPRTIPSGISYEWKRHTVSNAEDPSYNAFLRGQGWEPVPSSRHPELAIPGETDGPILRGGLMLCERPAYMTEEADAEQKAEAANTVLAKFQQLGEAPPNTLPRQNGQKGTLVDVKVGYGGMDIPG